MKDKHGRAVCGCGGYHFPHRKGGGACDYSLYADYHRALRAGVPAHLARELIPSNHLEYLHELQTNAERRRQHR